MSFEILLNAVNMAVPIFLSLHGVICIRLDINVLSIAFWCSILALAAATPARRAHLAQLANQHVQYDVRDMNWIEVLAFCIIFVVIKYSLANARAGMCTVQKISRFPKLTSI